MASSILFWRSPKSRFLVLDSITQHVAGKDFAVFLPEHVLQHLPGQENAIILTDYVLHPQARRQRQPLLVFEGLRCLVNKYTMAGAPRIARRLPCKP